VGVWGSGVWGVGAAVRMEKADTSAAASGSVADARQVFKRWLANNGDGQKPMAVETREARLVAVQQNEAEAVEAQFDLRVSAAGKLGLSLGPANTQAGSQLLQIVAVAAGGAAEQAAAAAAHRLRAGLVVAAVMGRSTLGEVPSTVMSMIKAAGRPLVLTLRPHPDEKEEDTVSAAGSAGDDEQRPLIVLSDLPLVHSNLRHPRFRVLPLREWDGSVAQLMAEKVDVLFVGRHIADFQVLPPTLLVNQFVGESCVTSKLLIQEMLVRNTAGRARPAWLPEQYVVPDQRVGLLNAWDRRQADAVEPAKAGGLQNSWIVRSGWGARSEGVWVTDSRAHLAELAESAKVEQRKWVVSRYIAAPALIDNCKFDLRFYVAVRRAGSAEQSPQIFIHKEFYCRRAIDCYSGSLHCRSKKQPTPAENFEQLDGADSPTVGQMDAFPATEHLTVHCYSDDANARAGQVFYSAAEFRKHWANDHGYDKATKACAVPTKDDKCSALPHEPARDVFGSELALIRRAIAELFSCAACEMGDPELWPSSRGLYGIDVMLQDTHQEQQQQQQRDRKNDQQHRTPHAAAGDFAGATTRKPRPVAYSAVILEANFSPDATRMLQYHPGFYDEVFSCLFLDSKETPGAARGQTQGDTGRDGTENGSVDNKAFLPLPAH
jgi:hypothetical protein